MHATAGSTAMRAEAEITPERADPVARMSHSMRLIRALAVTVIVAVAVAAAAGPATITLDGHPYVELAQVARTLQVPLDASTSSVRAHLRAGGHTVTLTRNWSQLLVDGRPVVLDAPVRVDRTGWLVPQSFVTRVVPQLATAGAAP